MAAIYDKALKRKDYSGIIDKDKQQEADQKKADANGHAAGKLIIMNIHHDRKLTGLTDKSNR